MEFGASATGRQSNYGVRAGVIEAILILALTLLAAPLRGSLEKWFRSLFERETALYRDVVVRAGAQLGQFRELNELCAFLESQIMSGLPLRRVKIVLMPEKTEGQPGSDAQMDRLLKRVALANELPSGK